MLDNTYQLLDLMKSTKTDFWSLWKVTYCKNVFGQFYNLFVSKVSDLSKCQIYSTTLIFSLVFLYNSLGGKEEKKNVLIVIYGVKISPLVVCVRYCRNAYFFYTQS